MRVPLTGAPYEKLDASRSWSQRGLWPANWIGCPGATAPFVSAFRSTFQLTEAATIRIHVSADERYELFLDGRRLGRGPERGTPSHWFFETYDLDLTPGSHVLTARVWACGDAAAPSAQMSVRPGFLLSPDAQEFVPLLATGTSPWEARLLAGYSWLKPTEVQLYGTGYGTILDAGGQDWDLENSRDGWCPAATLHRAFNATGVIKHERFHLLRPAPLPPTLEEPRQLGIARFIASEKRRDEEALVADPARHLPAEEAAWNAWLRGEGTLTLPPNYARRVLIDLGTYVCAFPEITVSGGQGSILRIFWAESLYVEQGGYAKGSRDEIAGKYFRGIGDVFLPDGGECRTFQPLWWQAGRYVELRVETTGQGLTLDRWELFETRTPLELESEFSASDDRLQGLVPMLWRSLQMCASETYMDCPYYEQKMWLGDTRLEILTTYAGTADARLPHKAVEIFGSGRLPSGLLNARHPTRDALTLPPFSLSWIAMLHDYMLWRGDTDFIRAKMPIAREILEVWLRNLNSDDLVEALVGWNFVDWASGWSDGIPPGADRGVSGILNWQLIIALKQVADLESWLDEPELSGRWQRLAHKIARSAAARFWNSDRGLFADDLRHAAYSEHSQCLAVLSRELSPEQLHRLRQNVFPAPNLTRTSIYFDHYYFEMCRELQHMDALFERLKFWFGLDAMGLRTTPEYADPTRSDCHGWGAHPLFHFQATLLGIRPGSPGFSSVQITPQLGPLQWIKGRLPHPSGGTIEVEARRQGAGLCGTVSLPPSVTGQLLGPAGKVVKLGEGRQNFGPLA